MRALLINTAFLGDVVFSLPVVENLGRAGYSVDLLTRPRYGALARGLPGYGAAIDYDKRGADRGGRGLRRLIRQLRGQYELVIGAHPSIRSGLIAAGVGGRSVGWGPIGYGTRVPRGPRFVDDGLALLDAAGVATPVRRPRVAVESAACGPVALIPGARWGTKRWPLRSWQALAERVGDFIVFGGCEEADLATAIGGERCIGAPLDETAAALASCSVAVGGDSGLVHLALAAGTPAVMLFGPTTASRHPLDPRRLDLHLDLPCQPCSPHGPKRCPLGHHACMRDLSVERTWQGLQQLRAGPG